MTEKQSKDAKSTGDAPESARTAGASGDRARTAGLPAEKTAESCPCGCNRDESAALFDTMPNEELLYDLADLFKVFADTTRIKILYALMGKNLCVADLAELIGATQSAVSHQLRTLKQARLVPRV